MVDCSLAHKDTNPELCRIHEHVACQWTMRSSKVFTRKSLSEFSTPCQLLPTVRHLPSYRLMLACLHSLLSLLSVSCRTCSSVLRIISILSIRKIRICHSLTQSTA